MNEQCLLKLDLCDHAFLIDDLGMHAAEHIAGVYRNCNVKRHLEVNSKHHNVKLK